MKRRPRPRRERIVDGGFVGRMLLTGALTAGVSFAAYVYGLPSSTPELARTYAFTALVFAELLRAFGARSETRTIWRMNVSSNVNLLVAIAAPITVQVWSQHNELLATFFKTTLISYRDGLVLLAVSALPLFSLETVKVFSRPVVAPLGGEARAHEGGPCGATADGAAAIGGHAEPDAPHRAPKLVSQAANNGAWGRQAAAGVCVLLAFGSGWLYWDLYSGGAVRYLTQKVERGSVFRTVTTSGVVNPTDAAPISDHASGVIQALSCDRNTKVARGQLCAKIDPRPYQLVVDQAKADLAAGTARLSKDRADLAQAKASLDSKEALAKRQAISRKALAASRKAYAQALARTSLAEMAIGKHKAALEAAEIDLGHSDIVAPFEGIVVSRNVEMGQTVAAGMEPPLFLIATGLALMRVDATVSEKDISAVKLGERPHSRSNFSSIISSPER